MRYRRISLYLSLVLAVLLSSAARCAGPEDIGALMGAFNKVTTPEAKRQAAIEIFKNYGAFKEVVKQRLEAGTMSGEFLKTARAVDEEMVSMSQEVLRQVSANTKNGVDHVVPMGSLGSRNTDPAYIPGKSDKDLMPVGPRAEEAAQQFNSAFKRKYGVDPLSLDLNVLDPTNPEKWSSRVSAIAEGEKYNTTGGVKGIICELKEKNRNIWVMDNAGGKINEMCINDVPRYAGNPLTKSDAAGFFSDNMRFREHYNNMGDLERMLKQSKYDVRNCTAYMAAGGELTATEKALLESAKTARQGKLDEAIEKYATAMGFDVSGEAAKKAVLKQYLKGMDDLAEKIGGKVVSAHLDDIVKTGGRSGVLTAELAGVIRNLPPSMAEKFGKEFAKDVARSDIWRQAGQVAKELGKQGVTEVFNKIAQAQFGKSYEALTAAERATLHGVVENSWDLIGKAKTAGKIGLAGAFALLSMHQAYSSEAEKGEKGHAKTAMVGRAILDLLQSANVPLMAAEIAAQVASLGIGLAIDSYKQDVLDKLYEAYLKTGKLDDVLNDNTVKAYFSGGIREWVRQLRESEAKQGNTLTDAEIEERLRRYFVQRAEIEKQAGAIEKKLAWLEAWVGSRNAPLIPGGDAYKNGSLSEEDRRKAMLGLLDRYMWLEEMLKKDGVYGGPHDVLNLLYLLQEGMMDEFAKALAKQYERFGKKVARGDNSKPKVAAAGMETTATRADTGKTGKGLAAIKSSKDASLKKATQPKSPVSGMVLFTKSGKFEKTKDGSCAPGVSVGPFTLTGSGRLKATVEGTPPVPGGWSISNYNTGLTLSFSPRLGQRLGNGGAIIELQGQLEKSKLSGEADWSGPGVLTGFITAPFGSGPLSGGCFEQSYTARCEIVEMRAEEPARAGEEVQPGDQLRTGQSGSSVLRTAGGSNMKVGPNSAVTLEKSATGGTRAVVNQTGGTGVRVQSSPGAKDQIEVQTGAYTLRPRGTEFVCYHDGTTSRVAVIEGAVDVVSSTGTVVTVRAGEQVALPGCGIEPYDVESDDRGKVGGIPLRSMLIDDEVPQPAGEFPCTWSNGQFSDGWVWEDPGGDAAIDTSISEMLRITVPDNNDFWFEKTDAPRLLHKVTGDFDLVCELDLMCTGTDISATQFVLRSPGSYAGQLSGQMQPDTEGAHYLMMSGGWHRTAGRSKLPLIQRKLADSADAPDGFVHLRMTRRGDLFRSYWSVDGATWNLAERQLLAYPETLWTGLVFKRFAHDRMENEPAVNLVRNLQVHIGPVGSLSADTWDLWNLNAAVTAASDSISLGLDGSALGFGCVESAMPVHGDFDAVVRYQAEHWQHRPGDSQAFTFYATPGDEKQQAYAGMAQHNDLRSRLHGDLAGARVYGHIDTAESSGWLRIRRVGSAFRIYHWKECEWIPFTDRDAAGFQEPAYLGFAISNENNATTASCFGVRFDVENIATGSAAAGTPWTPACSMLQAVSLPLDLNLPDRAEAVMFQAPFAIAKPFFGADGMTYVFSCERGVQRLIGIDSKGLASTVITTAVLAGINRKSGIATDDGFLFTVDGWLDGGNQYSGLFHLPRQGDYEQWPLDLDQGLCGIGDILTCPQGGWWICDFERDNIWHLKTRGAKLQPVLQGEIPGGLYCLAWHPGEKQLYALNNASGGPLTGKAGIYRISASGVASMASRAPDGEDFAGLAMSCGGIFGQSLYATEPKSGAIYRIRDGAEPFAWATGIGNAGDLGFNPRTGDMWVVCDSRYLLRVFAATEDTGGKRARPRETPVSEPTATPRPTPRKTIMPDLDATPTPAARQSPKPAQPAAPEDRLFRLRSKSEGKLLNSSYRSETTEPAMIAGGETHDAETIFVRANALFLGDGVTKDMPQAVRLYRQAAAKGHAKSMNSLGLLYFDGRGMPKDRREAARYFRMAAEAGLPRAQFNYARCLELGDGVDKDTAAAIALYRKAAEQGHASAQFNLAQLYARGEKAKKQPDEAIRWWTAAAEQDHAKALLVLGRMYGRGYWVTRDDKKAVAYLRRAIELGETKAADELTSMGVKLPAEDLARKYLRNAVGTWNSPFGPLQLATEGRNVRGIYSDGEGRLELVLGRDGVTMEGTWTKGPSESRAKGRIRVKLTDQWTVLRGIWTVDGESAEKEWIATRDRDSLAEQ